MEEEERDRDRCEGRYMKGRDVGKGRLGGGGWREGMKNL